MAPPAAPTPLPLARVVMVRTDSMLPQLPHQLLCDGAGAAARRYGVALRRRPLAAKRDAAWSPPPREVTSRVVGDGPARWWVCGPLAWDGEDYRRVVHTITGRHGVHAERARLRRRVVVTDARSGEELALWPPEPAAPAPLDEDDDDNAVEEGRAA